MGDADVWRPQALPLPQREVQHPFPGVFSRCKMDGLYVYEAGHGQVYVVAFPKPGGKFLVGDGFGPVWGRNGKEILYIDDHSRVASVEVTAHGDSVELGKPQILFPTQPVGPGLFEVSSDGNRFLMMQAPVQNSPSLTLVVNWPQEPKK